MAGRGREKEREGERKREGEEERGDEQRTQPAIPQGLSCPGGQGPPHFPLGPAQYSLSPVPPPDSLCITIQHTSYSVCVCVWGGVGECVHAGV